MSERVSGIEDWQQTRLEMIELLRKIASHGDTVSYSEFGQMLSDPLHHRNSALYELLRDICYDEREAGRPNLCALVVRKSDGMPGKGFFEYGALQGDDVSEPRPYWEQKVQECWRYYAAGDVES